MSREYTSLDGFVRIPVNMSEEEFKHQLTCFFDGLGVEYVENHPINVNGLSYRKGQHSAAFSEGIIPQKRYILKSIWDILGNKVTTLMMNPSSASEAAGDGTVGFMTNYVRAHFQAGSHLVINMSSYIEPDSERVNASYFIEDSLNRECIEKAIEWADIVFLAWGDKGGIGARKFKSWLKPLLTRNQSKLRCFEQSQSGNPIHKNSTKHNTTIYSLPSLVDLSLIF